MRSKGYKGRCTKKKLAKCKEVARLYDDLQIAFAEILEKDTDIKEIMVNFYLNDLSIGEFTSDFVAVRTSGDYLVRECVFRKNCFYQEPVSF